MPSQVIGVDPDKRDTLALHTVSGKTNRIEGAGSVDRLVLYSDKKYSNFIDFCKEHGDYQLINNYEGEGIVFSHGRYEKGVGAETRLPDPLSLLDQGWGTKGLSADFSIPGNNLSTAAKTWNLVQSGILALTSPSNMAALIAKLALTRTRYYVMISASPTVTGLKGEASRSIFGGVAPKSGVKATVKLKDVATALEAKRAKLTEEELAQFKDTGDD